MRIAFSLTAFFTLVIAGCGGVDWFPEKVKTPTTPTAFFFNNKTEVTTGETVSSDPVTITGIPSGFAPIKVTGDAGSKYRINSGEFTSTDGTVRNDDKVTVQHTASSQAGGTARTTLTVGDVSADFASTAAIVGKLVFPQKTVAVNQVAFSDPVKFSGQEGVAFPITVLNSVGVYAIASPGYTGDCRSLQTYTASQGVITNGQMVCLSNTSPATTTVIINNIVAGSFTSSP